MTFHASVHRMDQITFSRSFALSSSCHTIAIVFRHISQDLKERVLWLLENDFIPNDVADIFGVSRRSIYHWQANIENYGSVDRPRNPLHGRPCTLNAEFPDHLRTMKEAQQTPPHHLELVENKRVVAVKHGYMQEEDSREEFEET
jgi:transposase